jgi:hypothetical protein
VGWYRRSWGYGIERSWCCGIERSWGCGIEKLDGTGEVVRVYDRKWPGGPADVHDVHRLDDGVGIPENTNSHVTLFCINSKSIE